MSPSLLQQRWSSRKLVGDSKHVLIVRLRKGFMNRGYLSERRIDNGDFIVPPLIFEGVNHNCWKAAWTPVNNWMELPNVSSAKWSRSFDVQTGGEQGATTATIIMDNIAFPQEAGAAGLYHAIERGHFSPSRGKSVQTRPNPWPDAANEWKDVLNSGWQVEIWEGYGEGADVQLLTVPVNHSYAPASGALARTYTGIILDCETETHPDHITITCQDFSVFLTDQRLAGQNKAWEIPSPVTFADRKRTEGEQRLSGPYRRSSGIVTEDGVWTSQPDNLASDKEWIEMVLPSGHYEEIYVAASGRMQMYLSVYCNGAGKINGQPLGAGWVTLTGPNTGTINGTPYIRRMNVADDPARRWSLGHRFDLPGGSLVRLTFTDLFKQDGHYLAGTEGFSAYRFGTDPSNPPPGTTKVNAKGWVLVEDAADVVRMIFIWAGFQEWHIDPFGWSLFQPRIYGADKFQMDVITDMLTQGSFIFYMGAPTNDDRSIGVPHFEQMHVLNPPSPGMLEVRDTDLTEALTVKWDLSNLPYVIRYRGAITKKGGGIQVGFGIGGLTRRFEATYFPPWTGHWKKLTKTQGIELESQAGIERTATILRHFSETMGQTVTTQLESNRECLFACVLAAIQYALNMITAQFQVPGVAPLDLNEQVGVMDEASAVNSRVWTASIESDHVTGGGEQPGYWRMTIGGALIDTQEMVLLGKDYNYTRKLAQHDKARLASRAT